MIMSNIIQKEPMPNIFCQQNMLEIGGICNMPQYWLAPKFEKIKHSLHPTISHVENPFSASPICKKFNDAPILLLACIYYIVTSYFRRSAKPLYFVTSAVVFTFTTSLYLRYACCIAIYILCADCTYIVCSVYILPLLLLYIFTTILYFIYACIVVYI